MRPAKPNEQALENRAPLAFSRTRDCCRRVLVQEDARSGTRHQREPSREDALSAAAIDRFARCGPRAVDRQTAPLRDIVALAHHRASRSRRALAPQACGCAPFAPRLGLTRTAEDDVSLSHCLSARGLAHNGCREGSRCICLESKRALSNGHARTRPIHEFHLDGCNGCVGEPDAAR